MVRIASLDNVGLLEQRDLIIDKVNYSLSARVLVHVVVVGEEDDCHQQHYPPCLLGLLVKSKGEDVENGNEVEHGEFDVEGQ